MRTRSFELTLATAALGLCVLAGPSQASIAPQGAAPHALPGAHGDEILVARGGGGRGGGGGGRGGGGGGRGGGGYGGGGGARAGGGGYGGGGGARAGGYQGGGSRNVRANANSNVNYNGNRNVNRNSNVNRNNVNVNNFNGNGGGCCGYGNGWDHPVAAAATVGAVAGMTAAAIGSTYYSVPPSCVQNGGYYQCGSTWYQPQYSGTNVQYTVVNPPY
jgi:hypothetical protein